MNTNFLSIQDQLQAYYKALPNEPLYFNQLLNLKVDGCEQRYINNILFKLIDDGQIVRYPLHPLKFISKQYLNKEHTSRILGSDDNVSMDDSLRVAKLREHLKFYAKIYDLNNRKSEVPCDADNFTFIKQTGFKFENGGSYSVYLQLKGGQQDNAYEDQQYLGFPNFVCKSQGKLTFLPLFIISLKDRFSKYTYRLDKDSWPVLNYKFVDGFLKFYSKTDDKKQAKLALENFQDELYKLYDKDSLSAALVEITRLINQYLAKYISGYIDFDNPKIKNDSSLSVGKIYNYVLLIESKAYAFTSGTVYDLNYIAEQASDRDILNSGLRFMIDSFDDEVKEDQHFSSIKEDINPYDLYATQEQLKNNYDKDLWQDDAVSSMLHNYITLLEGPPGTGKTQTIANVCFNQFCRGKTCLVTSRNHAAIDAFCERSEKSGLDFVTRLVDKDNNIDIDYRKLISDLYKGNASDRNNVNNTVFTSRDGYIAELIAHDQQLSKLNDLVKLLINELTAQCSEFDYNLEQFKSYCNAHKAKSSYNKLQAKLALLQGSQTINESLLKIVLQKSKIEDLKQQALKCKLANKKPLLWPLCQYHGIVRSEFEHFSQLNNQLIADFISILDHLSSLVAEVEFNDLSYEQDAHNFVDSLLNKIYADANKLKESNKVIVANLIKLTKDILNKDKSKNNDAVAKPNFTVPLISNTDFKTIAKAVADDKYSATDKKRLLDLLNSALVQDCASIVFKAYGVTTTSLLSINKSVPLLPSLIDLVIIDEASQLNMIEALPIIYRAKRFAIVGDPHQLEPVGSISKSLVAKIKNTMDFQALSGVEPNDSCYDFINKYHSAYRCYLINNRRSHPDIVAYISKAFYNSRLQPKKQHNCKYHLANYDHFQVFDVVDDIRSHNNSKYSLPEVERTIKLLEDIYVAKQYQGCVGILSPFKQQIEKISSALMDNDYLSSLFNSNQISVQSVHSAQGQEFDTVIYSACINSSSFACNEKLINVALSRAKDYLFIVSNTGQIRRSSYSYINHMLSDERLKDSDLVNSIQLINKASQSQIKFDTQWERMFYIEIQRHINEQHLPLKIYTQVNALNYRLDLLMVSTIDASFKLDIEIDGRQHYYINGNLITYDKTRAQRLEEYLGIKTIRFTNKRLTDNIEACIRETLNIWTEFKSAKNIMEQ